MTTETTINLTRQGFHGEHTIPVTGRNPRIQIYQGERHVLLDLDRDAADAMFDAAACPSNTGQGLSICLCGGVHAPERVSPLSSEMGDMSGTYAIPVSELTKGELLTLSMISQAQANDALVTLGADAEEIAEIINKRETP